jgi:hypothetical protein
MNMNVMRTKKLVRLFILLSISGGIGAIVGCDNKPTTTNSNTATSNTSAPTSKGAKSGATGTLTATPNPIKVCDGTGLGVADISWTYAGAKLVEVRIGAPDGGLLVQAGGEGTKTTGKWVGPNTVFYLQDVSNGLPLTAENTITTLTVNVTTQGCP